MDAADWVFDGVMVVAAVLFLCLWWTVSRSNRARVSAEAADPIQPPAVDGAPHDWTVVQNRGVRHLPLWSLACLAAAGVWTWATLSGNESLRVWIALAFAVLSLVFVVAIVMGNKRAMKALAAG